MAQEFQVIQLGSDFGFQVVDRQIGEIICGPFNVGTIDDVKNLLNALRSNTTDAFFDSWAADAAADPALVAEIEQLRRDTTFSWEVATQLGYDLGGTAQILYGGTFDGTSLASIMQACEAEAIDLASEIIDLIQIIEFL